MNADEQAIRNVVAQWHRASAAGDVDTILGLMSEDAVFLVSGRPPVRGRPAFEKGLRDLLKSFRLESRGDVQEVRTPLSGGKARERSRIVQDANLLPAPDAD